MSHPPRSRAGRVIGRVLYVGALSVGISIAITAYATFNTDEPAAGQCVNITDADTAEPGWRRADCGSTESDFVIAKVTASSDTCPPGYATASQDTRRTSGMRLCLVPDVVVGDCLRVPRASIETKVRCGEPDADAEVIAVASNTGGGAACPPGTGRFTVYPDPARTVCTKTSRQ
ncbi:LppU/SCO3897 family protein [Saccharopolyspora sp. 5N708]|uniref:LppU/SCO3897 family protein n=1 Tax=Saccharopolyspora sp. 5N708 TaxID=3457424 RepID=UPI003FD2D890